MVEIDREALLAALVLAPATYSRNRFFDLYKNADVRRVRRRASALRSLLRQLARGVDETRLVETERGAELSFVVPALGLRRTANLESLELAVLRFALASAGVRRDGPLALPPADRARVESTLSRLAPS
jgi:predicted small lipoprotein YifL